MRERSGREAARILNATCFFFLCGFKWPNSVIRPASQELNITLWSELKARVVVRVVACSVACFSVSYVSATLLKLVVELLHVSDSCE